MTMKRLATFTGLFLFAVATQLTGESLRLTYESTRSRDMKLSLIPRGPIPSAAATAVIAVELAESTVTFIGGDGREIRVDLQLRQQTLIDHKAHQYSQSLVQVPEGRAQWTRFKALSDTRTVSVGKQIVHTHGVTAQLGLRTLEVWTTPDITPPRSSMAIWWRMLLNGD